MRIPHSDTPPLTTLSFFHCSSILFKTIHKMEKIVIQEKEVHLNFSFSQSQFPYTSVKEKKTLTP